MSNKRRLDMKLYLSPKILARVEGMALERDMPLNELCSELIEVGIACLQPKELKAVDYAYQREDSQAEVRLKGGVPEDTGA